MAQDLEYGLVSADVPQNETVVSAARQQHISDVVEFQAGDVALMSDEASHQLLLTYVIQVNQGVIRARS